MSTILGSQNGKSELIHKLLMSGDLSGVANVLTVTACRPSEYDYYQEGFIGRLFVQLRKTTVVAGGNLLKTW